MYDYDHSPEHYEFYWDEDDDWGRHSYCETYTFNSYNEALQFRDLMIRDPNIYNVVFMRLEDNY